MQAPTRRAALYACAFAMFLLEGSAALAANSIPYLRKQGQVPLSKPHALERVWS